MLKAILFNDTSYENHHGSQLVVKQIYQLAEEAGICVIRACPMRHDWRTDERLKHDIAQVDLCLVNGEGTMHDDAKRAVILSELAPFCYKKKVSCFLINSVWQGNQKILSEARYFTKIYLRDRLSQKELAQQDIDSIVVPDLTLSFQVDELGESRKGFLTNGSVYEYRAKQAWVQANKIENVDYISIIAPSVIQVGKGFNSFLVKSLISRFKCWRKKIFAKYFSFRTLNDKEISDLRWCHSEPNLQYFIKRLKNSRGVITGRFHCVTLCLLTQTPFYSIRSNTHKIEGMLQEVNLEKKRIFDSYEEALKQRENIAFTDVEKENIKLFLINCRKGAQQMFYEIYCLASENKKRKMSGQ